MTDTYSHQRFSQQLNTTLRLVPPQGAAIPLDLIEVSQVRRFSRYEAFSIVLRGPAGCYIPQANYSLEPEQGESFDLFIVPIRQDQHGIYYEATFNLLCAEVPA